MVTKKRTRSAIGRQNRKRGGNSERELVNTLIGVAGVPAEKISMLESGGVHKGDIQFKTCATDETWINCQVKHEKAVPSYPYKHLEGYQVLFMKQTGRRNGWLVCLPLDFFMEKFL